MFQEWDTIDGCIVNEVPTLACIPVVMQNVISALLLFAGASAAILIVYGAIRMINSGGDQKTLAGSRQIITYAIIGLILVLLSFAFIYTIAYITNTNCITELGIDVCK